MTPADLLHLASGAWELEVQPARGGAVTSLRHRGRTVLLSPGPPRTDAIGSATFALVPYANRIAAGNLEHAGRRWTLPRNYDDHPHPLHGTGWKRPWQVTQQKSDRVELSLQHEPDAHWPWAFTARQRIQLTADAARFELGITNDAAERAPAGIGFHPAFAACASTRMRTEVDGVWLIDEGILPVSHAQSGDVLPELPGAVPMLRSVLVDHCFTGWSRQMYIDKAGAQGDMDLAMTAAPGLEFLQLYMPPGKNWFCAEPMSQMPDAVNQADHVATGLRYLAPGESLQGWMSIAVREPPAHG